MSTIIIGDVAAGSIWWSQAAFYKTELARLYKQNNAFMQAWKFPAADVKIHVIMRAGQPVAFIYVDVGWDILLREDTSFDTFKAKRVGNTVEFIPVTTLFGADLSWTNGRDKACSADIGYSAITISGVPFSLALNTPFLMTLRAIANFSKTTGVFVSRGFASGTGDSIQFFVATFVGDIEANTADYTIIHSADEGEVWDTCIVSKDSTAAVIKIVRLRDSVSLDILTFTLDEQGNYSLSIDNVLTTPIATRTFGTSVRSQTLSTGVGPSPRNDDLYEGGDFDYDVIPSAGVPTDGITFEPMTLSDFGGVITIPTAEWDTFSGTSFLQPGTGYGRWASTGGTNGTYTAHGETTRVSRQEKTVTKAIFNSQTPAFVDSIISTITSTFSGDDTHLYAPGVNVNNYTTSTHLTRIRHTNSRTIRFADANVQVYDENILDDSDIDATLTTVNTTGSQGITYTQTSSFNTKVELDGVVIYEYTPITTSTSPTTNISTELNTWNVPVTALVTQSSTTSTEESPSATQPLGDLYAYSKDLYAIRVPSPYGTFDSANPNKILFLPIDGGVIKPVVIGEFNYTNLNIFIGLHKD